MKHPILLSVITGMHISGVHILSLGSPYTGSSTSDPSLLQVVVTFDRVDKGGLELRYPYGFELGCSASKGEQHNCSSSTPGIFLPYDPLTMFSRSTVITNAKFNTGSSKLLDN